MPVLQFCVTLITAKNSKRFSHSKQQQINGNILCSAVTVTFQNSGLVSDNPERYRITDKRMLRRRCDVPDSLKEKIWQIWDNKICYINPNSWGQLKRLIQSQSDSYRIEIFMSSVCALQYIYVVCFRRMSSMQWFAQRWKGKVKTIYALWIQ